MRYFIFGHALINLIEYSDSRDSARTLTGLGRPGVKIPFHNHFKCYTKDEPYATGFGVGI